MLEVRNIEVYYDDLQVLWNVSFNIQPDEVVALVGANGAGKSTTLNTISGLLRPCRGEIYFEGRPIHTAKPYHFVEMGIAHCPEARQLFTEMTVEENLAMGALRGVAKKKRAQTTAMVFELFPRLRERCRQLAGTLSGGEQQMVAIGRALMSRPRLLMFDEPSLGLAPILVREVFEAVRQISQEGTTILIVEQNVRQSLAIADRAYVLETGRLVLEGTGAELLHNEHIKTAYLGV